jgi:hypothetical protein
MGTVAGTARRALVRHLGETGRASIRRDRRQAGGQLVAPAYGTAALVTPV